VSAPEPRASRAVRSGGREPRAAREDRDQANTLRILASERRPRGFLRETSRVEPPERERRDPRPDEIWTVPQRVIVVTGGSPGSGATTVARCLAAEARRRAIRAVLLEPGGDEEAAPGGAEFYLLDGGVSPALDGLADYLVLVATPDAEAVTGVYSALKRCRRSDPGIPAGLVVNRARSAAEGAALAERVATVSRAFLGGPGLEVLGSIPEDPEALLAGRRGRRFAAASPLCAAGAGVRLCAKRLWSRWRPRWSVIAA
jgi:hypothetical protein